jgi:hypothetical protein
MGIKNNLMILKMNRTTFLTATSALLLLAASCGQPQPKTIPDELLIVPGVRVGTLVLNQDDMDEINVDDAKFRTAENIGLGSTLEELTNAYKNYIMTGAEEGDVSVYQSVDEMLAVYLPDGFDDGQIASIACLKPNGEDMGISFGISLKKSNNPDKVKKESKVIILTVYNADYSQFGTAQLYYPEDDGERNPFTLSPTKTFESEFVAFGVNPEDENDSFVRKPDGEFYHFYAYTGYGDSQWDALLGHEEHFTASSSLPPTAKTKYGADNLSNDIRIEDKLVGGLRSTAWCEGVKGYGIGEWVNMSIRTKSSDIHWSNRICFPELMIVNGYAKDAVTWKNNSRVKTLRLYVGDTHWCDLQLDDVIKPQIFQFKEADWIYPSRSGKQIPAKGAFSNPWADNYPEIPIYQTDLKFEIIEVYPGDKYDDTCITGIAVDVYGGLY